jgi:glycosyltransferase involved in cell wall biosynthesis
MARKLRVALVSSFDRACGIADFTAQLRDNLEEHKRKIEFAKVVAIDKKPNFNHDPNKVFFTICQDNTDSWAEAAPFLASMDVDVVHLQHENGLNNREHTGYGILAEGLQKRHIPVVTTFHTLEYEPHPLRLQDTAYVAANSTRIISLNKRAVKEILHKGVYGMIPKEKIKYTPHPVRDTDVSPQRRDFLEKTIGLRGRVTSVTLGMISEKKGIDKIAESIGEVWNNRKYLPEQDKKKLLHLIIGDGHPDFREDNERWEAFLQTWHKSLDEHSVPWSDLAGLREFVERDLSPYAAIIIPHRLAENEFCNCIALPHYAIVANQDKVQAATGPGSEFAAARPLIISRSAASEGLINKISSPDQNMLAEERDSGYLIDIGKSYVNQMAQVMGRYISDTEHRLKHEQAALARRQNLTWSYQTGKKIEIYEEAIASI